MQILVLLQIFIDLNRKGKLTRNYLAEKYELSTKTISRYVDVLTQAGIPIESVRGVGGGYIMQNYNLERGSFNAAEWKRIREALVKTEHAFDDNLNETILDKCT